MTAQLSPIARADLVGLLQSEREMVARRLTDEYFVDHPEFEAAHPPHARLRTREDFGFLIDFVAGALAANDPSRFADMVVWTARVLEARGIGRDVLVDSLRRLGRGLRGVVQPEARTEIAVHIEAGVDALTAPIPDPDDRDLPLSCRVYLQAVLQGDRRAALGVATEALQRGLPVATVYLDILQSAMYEIGRLWEANEITVADEHLATAITQWVLAQLYDRLEVPEVRRGRAVITGIEGELHQVGANMVADILESDGWDVRFLGSNVPHAAVLRAVEEHRAEILGVSATMLFHLSRVERLVRDVRERFGDRLKIVVGGAAFRSDPALAERIGADGFAADLNGAVATLREIA